MKKTTIFWSLFGLLIFAGLIIYARPNSDTKPTNESQVVKGTGMLKAEHDLYDFGTISMRNGNVMHTYAIKNTSDSAVKIEKMYTSCMCTTATLLKDGKKWGPFGMPGHGYIPAINVVVGPGEELSVDAVFDPNAHGPAGIGKIERAIILENSAGSSIQLMFSANVSP